MKIFKKILFCLLVVADMFALYSTIGYFVLGLHTPKIIGVGKTSFMGMYLMSITFLCVTILLSTIILIFTIKYFKARKLNPNLKVNTSKS